ncbi:MAG: PH domain-containing protein [bacterium]|nr:PH domain-containing protein [bacterium]
MHDLKAKQLFFKIPGGYHDDEVLLAFLRRHWFVMFLNAVMFIVLMAIPIGIYALVPAQLLGWIQGTPWEGIIVMFFSAYYLMMWLFFFAALVDYYLDVWIVTSERIIDILQISLFRHVVAEQRIVRVQDVTSTVQGILPTFLNYGNVNIQTAGEQERFVFEQVPNPEGVKRIIFQAYEDGVRKFDGEAQTLDTESRRDGEGPLFEGKLHK